MQKGNKENRLIAEARTLNDLLNTLSLFSRRTTVEWLPELVAERGITSERFMVMWELMLQPDRSLKQLAFRMGVSPSSMSVMVNSMVEAGLVARVTDSEDRRRVVLRLTQFGEAELVAGESFLIERYREFLESLPDDDRTELTSAATAMLSVVGRILDRF